MDGLRDPDTYLDRVEVSPGIAVIFAEAVDVDGYDRAQLRQREDCWLLFCILCEAICTSGITIEPV